MRDKKNRQASSKALVLPEPTYDNSFIFSLTAAIEAPPSGEMDYIKEQFGGGLYTRLSVTNFLSVSMDWHIDLSEADAGIQKFKNTVDALVKNVNHYEFGLHLILTYGMSRDVNLYREAKVEDIRNAQWFNDNNLATKAHIEAGGIDKFVYTTFSRYARKLRKHLETMVKATFNYLKAIQDKNPGLILIISAPGEAELNATRINNQPNLQDYFCDYSPFALLEFRDWITHEGMYGSGGTYEGEGYKNGGTRYQGNNGLQNFKTDFGADFDTWDLKYFNWSLSDHVDTNYTDNINNDPNIIPFSQYTFDGMMKQSGPHFIAGGFDPPRQMKKKGQDRYWDLYQEFRETMVYHFVRDMGNVAKSVGFAKDKYFTHQIPADYLWGTRPDDPDIPLNARYYASASPMWTADAFPNTGMGITMYDVNFITYYARTSKYSVPAIASMSDNWGALEYNPEVIVTDNIDDINTVENIYRQIIRLYDNNAHMMSFFKWEAELRYEFKGTNREGAARKFFQAVKDKARQPVETVFIPSAIAGFSGRYDWAGKFIALSWSTKIWAGLAHHWTDWGDFKEFVLYRGYTENFTCNKDTEIARTTSAIFTDKTFNPKAGDIYYKIAAVNAKNQNGTLVSNHVKIPVSGEPPFGAYDTPIEGSNVSGSIAVTGWALDDIEVESVKIYREEGTQWAYVGDAVFVEGTRPDVAAAYPNYPFNTRAGWGYLLLTNLLPGKGNGTYRLKAVARSVDGQETVLGIRTINSDNAHAVKPFGAIDTPAQGGIASGASYVNFGWALTPQPNKIPLNGSTIDVLIDGVEVGHPTYNNYRKDIATLFPGYANSNGAVGYFYINTLNYADGMHTISWRVRDNAGNSAGIGSRYFFIKNH